MQTANPCHACTTHNTTQTHTQETQAAINTQPHLVYHWHYQPAQKNGTCYEDESLLISRCKFSTLFNALLYCVPSTGPWLNVCSLWRRVLLSVFDVVGRVAGLRLPGQQGFKVGGRPVKFVVVELLACVTRTDTKKREELHAVKSTVKVSHKRIMV